MWRTSRTLPPEPQASPDPRCPDWALAMLQDQPDNLRHQRPRTHKPEQAFFRLAAARHQEEGHLGQQQQGYNPGDPSSVQSPLCDSNKGGGREHGLLEKGIKSRHTLVGKAAYPGNGAALAEKLPPSCSEECPGAGRAMGVVPGPPWLHFSPRNHTLVGSVEFLPEPLTGLPPTQTAIVKT